MPTPDPGYLDSHTNRLETGLTAADLIGVGVNGIPFGSGDLGQIAEGVEVSALHGLLAVDGELQQEDLPQADASSDSGVITFVPSAPLAEGWYRLSVDLGGLEHYTAPGFDADPGRPGAHSTDFRVGSLPLLRVESAVQDSHVIVFVTMTEPVRASDEGVEVLDLFGFAMDDATVECVPTPSAVEPDLWQARAETDRLTFSCPSSARPATLTVTVAPGVVSVADGTPLRDLDGNEDIVLRLSFGDLGSARSPARVTDAVLALRSGPTADAAYRALRRGETVRFVGFGTSLTAGGAWLSQTEAALAAELPGDLVAINAAESARWSGWAVDVLDERVLSADPDIVVLEFGINDAYTPYATTVDQARANWVVMIDRILANGPDTEVVLMTTNVVTGDGATARPEILAYYAMVRDLAEGRELRVVDTAQVWVDILERAPDLFAELVPDGVHPTALAHCQITTPMVLDTLRGTPRDAATIADALIAATAVPGCL